MLRLEAPYEQLCPHFVCVNLHELEEHDWRVFALLLPKFQSLNHLNLMNVDLSEPGHLDAVVDAVIATDMAVLNLSHAMLDPATAIPAISRLLRCGALQVLEVLQCPYVDCLLAEPSFAAELADALRSNTRLRALTLGGIDLWRDAAVGNTIVAAISGHASLKALKLCCNHVAPADKAEVSNALLALVADTPELCVLNIRGVLEYRDGGDSCAILADFHEKALAINPALSLPSLEDLEADPDQSDEASSGWETASDV
jgi:hypothetical protein